MKKCDRFCYTTLDTTLEPVHPAIKPPEDGKYKGTDNGKDAGKDKGKDTDAGKDNGKDKGDPEPGDKNMLQRHSTAIIITCVVGVCVLIAVVSLAAFWAVNSRSGSGRSKSTLGKRSRGWQDASQAVGGTYGIGPTTTSLSK